MTFIQYYLNEIVGKDQDLREVEAMIPFGNTVFFTKREFTFGEGYIKGFQSSKRRVGVVMAMESRLE